jgi:hypothetical protein
LQLVSFSRLLFLDWFLQASRASLTLLTFIYINLLMLCVSCECVKYAQQIAGPRVIYIRAESSSSSPFICDFCEILLLLVSIKWRRKSQQQSRSFFLLPVFKRFLLSIVHL